MLGAEIKIGSCLVIEGGPCVVVERDFVRPLKGPSFARLRAKNLRTGQFVNHVVKVAERIEEARVELADCSFQYSDGENYMLMNARSFEQFGLPIMAHEDKGPYLKQGETYTVVLWKGEPIDIKLPCRMIFTVVACEGAGGTEGSFFGVTKIVRTETGLLVRVPHFVELGDRILVATEAGDFVERVG